VDEAPRGEVDEAPSADELGRFRRLVAGASATRAQATNRANELLDQHKHRPLVDVTLGILERDREAVGSVLGSALALRLFLFFVPLLVFLVGVLGFLASSVEPDQLNSATGVTGKLAEQVSSAFTQPTSTRWIAVATGLFGMLSAGRALSKVLTASSALAWRLPVRPKASMRVVGMIVGILVGVGLCASIANRIRHAWGITAAGASFAVVLLVYLAAWTFLYYLLPRATPDLGAVLPGGMLVALVLTVMQSISQLYLPDRFGRASELYGSIGIAVVTLGWFFFLGRAVVLGIVVNAVVYERFGSITELVFSLPVLRAIPRRFPSLRRALGLPEPDA
jgi:uncharacterized BrkB/YihY/UPF0761 family membrane protein